MNRSITEPTNYLRGQIEAIHTFISTWFRGECPHSDSHFDHEFAAQMGEGLVNIQPSGETLSRSQLVASIRHGYGANPNFRITISDCMLRSIHEEGRLALLTYRELQQGARNTTPADNARISTVLLQLPEAGARAT